jgi:hypothetical protein
VVRIFFALLLSDEPRERAHARNREARSRFVMHHFITKEVFHRNSREDFSKEKNIGPIARAIQQVFPLIQPAIQLSQRELPLPRDSSRSLQAHWWELELSQE